MKVGPLTCHLDRSAKREVERPLYSLARREAGSPTSAFARWGGEATSKSTLFLPGSQRPGAPRVKASPSRVVHKRSRVAIDSEIGGTHLKWHAIYPKPHRKLDSGQIIF